jgi:serine/threonine-protein kinase 11
MVHLDQDGGSEHAHRLKKVNSYRLCAKIGSGSSAVVYLGIDDRSGQKYAIKRIRLRELARTSAGVAQLEREVRLIKLFDHPNILKISEVLHIPTTEEVYLVLEYAENGSLGGFVEREQQLSHAAIFSIVKQTLEALKHLHDSGYVHQDIKPCNILLDGNGRVKLADFGIGHSFTSAAMVVGSPAYQAPEALDDQNSSDDDSVSDSSAEGPQKEDIWALGVTLYQLLFSKLPFVGENLYEIVNLIRGSELEIPENCEPAVADLLRKMLTVDPSQRISVEELQKDNLIANASDLAEGLPDVPPPKMRDGELVELQAQVCPEGFSFVALCLAVPRRFSYHMARRVGEIEVGFPRTKPGRAGGSHSDGEDEGPHSSGGAKVTFGDAG